MTDLENSRNKFFLCFVSKMRSKVWQYFDKIHESGVAKAQCQECGKILCTPNGSTSALKTHLKKCRNIETGKETCE